MLDGSLATAQGPGLGRVRANDIAKFAVMTRPVGGEPDLLVYITCKYSTYTLRLSPVHAILNSSKLKVYRRFLFHKKELAIILRRNPRMHASF